MSRPEPTLVSAAIQISSPFGVHAIPPVLGPAEHGVVADLVEGMRRCHRQGRVVRLVVANQGQLQSSVVEAGTRHRNEMAAPTQRFRCELNLVAQPPDRRAGAERVLLDYC